MKKLTINRLALGNLKARRKQYTLIVTSIVLAMTFAVSVMLLLLCMDASNKEYDNIRFGKQDMTVLECADIDFNRMYTDGKLTAYGFGNVFAYALPKDEGAYKIGIAFLDDAAFELSYPVLIDGEYPDKEGEIAAEQAVLYSLGLSDAKVGDTVALTATDNSGKEAKREYLLTGILRDKRKNIINQISSTSDAQEYIPGIFTARADYDAVGGEIHRICYASVSESFGKHENFHDYFSAYNIYIGDSLYMKSLGVSDYTYALRTAFMCVIAVILMLISCIGVINSFTANLAERRKQIGMMRAVGATRRQIVKIFGREALIICLMSVPLSILLSVGLVFAVIKIVGNGFVFSVNVPTLIFGVLAGIIFVMAAALIPLSRAAKTTPVQAIRDIDMTRKMKKQKLKNRKSFNVSRLIAERNLTFRKGRFALVSILLALSVLLTSGAFNILNIVFFEVSEETDMPDYCISEGGGSIWSTFVNYPNEAKKTSFSENIRHEIELIPYVESTVGEKTGFAAINLPSESLYSDMLIGIGILDKSLIIEEMFDESLDVQKSFDNILSDREAYNQYRTAYDLSENYAPCSLCSFDLSVLKELSSNVIDGKINLDKISSGEEIILYAPQKLGFGINYDIIGNERAYDQPFTDFGSYFDNGNEYPLVARQDIFHAGDEIELTVPCCDTLPEVSGDGLSVGFGEYDNPDGLKLTKKKVKIGAIIDTDKISDSYLTSFAELSIITSNEAMEGLIPDLPYKSIKINTLENLEITDEINEEILERLESLTADTRNAYISSDFSTKAENEQTYIGICVAIFAVIMLIFCAAVSLINNFLTAQVRESKQKIGTLRAVGADKNILKKSFIYQLIAMTATGMSAGYALCFIAYAVLKIVNGKYELGIMQALGGLQLWQPLIFGIAIFAICTVNLYSKVKSLTKYSIVENIREL